MSGAPTWLSVMLVGSSALAADPSGVPKDAKVAPTAWACTVRTLQDGQTCYFETSESRSPIPVDAAEQARQNAQLIRQLGDSFCRGATRREPGKSPTPEVVKACTREFDAIAADCGLDGEVPLLDEGGRFNPRARECYQGLSRVLSEAHTAAALAPDCCRCLEENRCVASTAECNGLLAKNRPQSSWQACIVESCPGACAAYAAPPPPPKSEQEEVIEPRRRTDAPRKETRL